VLKPDAQDAAPPIESPTESPETCTIGSPALAPNAEPAETMRKIEDLPREVGALLVSVGVVGFVLPGMMGTPALIAGGLVLWPKAFSKLDNWFQRRYPSLHQQGMQQVCRYLDDLDRRFPDGVRKSS
jgi:hypothetical protein